MSAGLVDLDVLAFLAKLVVAGDAATDAQRKGVIYMIPALKSAGLWNSIDHLNLLCGQTLAGAMIPIKATVGTSPNTYTSFVNGDIGAKGITGGTNKWINPGIDRANCRAADDVSMGVYVTAIADYATTQGLICGTNLEVFFDVTMRARVNATALMNPHFKSLGLNGLSRYPGGVNNAFSGGGSGAASGTPSAGSGGLRVFSRINTSYSNSTLGGFWFGAGLQEAKFNIFQSIWDNTMRIMGRLTASVPIKVIIMAGQSNMAGRANTGYVLDQADYQTVYAYDTDGPSGQQRNSYGRITNIGQMYSEYYGPEIKAARGIATGLGQRIAVIKVAFGGTALATDWNSRTAGYMWERYKTTVSQALTSMVECGFVPQVSGFLWMQGETDGLSDAASAAYAQNYRNLLADVKTHLLSVGYSTSALKIITAKIHTNATRAFTEVVRTAQQTVTDEQPAGTAAIFSTESLTLQGDDLHFDEAGNNGLGDLFASTYLAL